MGAWRKAMDVGKMEVLRDKETSFGLSGAPYFLIRPARQTFRGNSVHRMPRRGKDAYKRLFRFYRTWLVFEIVPAAFSLMMLL